LLDQSGPLGDEYPRTVAGSLALSLGEIGRESAAARGALDVLCFLAPDGISKPLLQEPPLMLSWH
jgi:hypothetical protein